MSESVWIAVLTVIGGPVTVTILGIVGYMLRRRIDKVSKEVAQTKQEITNSHPVHLRDDLDGKFKLVFARQDTMMQEIKRISEKMDAHREDIDRLYSTTADHEGRLSGQAAHIRRMKRSN